MRSEWADDMTAERLESWSDYIPETPEHYEEVADAEVIPIAGRFDTGDYDPWAA